METTPRLGSAGRRLLVAVATGAVALLAASPAPAHDASGIRASIVRGSVSFDQELKLAYGRIRVTNRRTPTGTRPYDVVACRVAVYSRDGRNITTGRVTNPWDTVGRVRRRDTRVLRFMAIFEYDERAHHLRLRHCHTPWVLN